MSKQTHSVTDLPKLAHFLATTMKILDNAKKEIESLVKQIDPKMLESIQHDGELLADIVTPGGENTLSDTQKKILDCYRKGMVRRKFIAAELQMNPHTLDVQVVRLREKLGLKSIHELVAYATEPRR